MNISQLGQYSKMVWVKCITDQHRISSADCKVKILVSDEEFEVSEFGWWMK